jgi:hypothetical protein
MRRMEQSGRLKASERDSASAATLPAWQEQLLLSYLDGECSVLKRGYVRWLLRSNRSARAFFEEFSLLSKEVHSCNVGGAMRSSEGEGWSQLLSRIGQEEHAALLLGERRGLAWEKNGAERQSGRVASWREISERMLWSMGGAVTAAIAVMLVVPQFAPNGQDDVALRQSLIANQRDQAEVGQVAIADVPKPLGFSEELAPKFSNMRAGGMSVTNVASVGESGRSVFSSPGTRSNQLHLEEWDGLPRNFSPMSPSIVNVGESYGANVFDSQVASNTQLVSNMESDRSSSDRRRVERTWLKRLQRSLAERGQDNSSAFQQIVRRSAEPPVEIDWMRSGGGRVHLFQDAPTRSTIIWVRRGIPDQDAPVVTDRDFQAPQTVPAFR